MSYDLSIIVPVYNEEKTVLQLLEKLVNAPLLLKYSLQIIVVNDGSTDRTTEVLKNNEFIKDSRFVWLTHSKNQGKGAAIRTGLKSALGEYTIIQDADLEYDPNDIAKLLEHAKQNNLAAVFGSRNLNPKNKTGTPAFYWGGKTISWLTNLLFGQKLTDEPTCYKLVKTNLLKSLPLTCQRFEFCPELTAQLSMQNIKIPELPISYFPRGREQGKKIGFLDWLEAVWTLFSLRLNKAQSFFILACVSAAVVFLRKPETLLHAQLWAEDGNTWLAQAYYYGPLKSLLISDGGYYQTFSRLMASLAVYLPLNKVPLVFNSVEFFLQISVALFFITNRFKNLVPNTAVRFLLVALYLFLPNTAEIDGHLTSSQWYLAVLAFLVLVAYSSEQNRLWVLFDYFALFISGLSGAFAIFLSPLAGILWLVRRTRHSFFNFLIISTAAVLQAASIFVISHENRVHVLSEFTPKVIFAIFSRQVIFGLLAGARGYTWLLSHTDFALGLVSAVSCLCIILIIYSLFKAPLELKLFIVFGLAIFFASLLTPTIKNLSFPILKLFSRSQDGIRYWFVPMLSFGAVLVWGLVQKNLKVVKWLSGVLLVVSVFGIVMDFRHLPYPDLNFNFYAKKFAGLQKGQHLIIPITPPGWEMDLVKR